MTTRKDKKKRKQIKEDAKKYKVSHDRGHNRSNRKNGITIEKITTATRSTTTIATITTINLVVKEAFMVMDMVVVEMADNTITTQQ